MYFEKAIFPDGVYIDRQEVIAWYESVQGDSVYNMSQVNTKFVCGCLDILKGLSKFYTMETIERYFKSLLKEPLKGELSDLHDTLCCFGVSDQRKKQIEWIINNFSHKIDKTAENANNINSNSKNKALNECREEIEGIVIKLRNIEKTINAYLDPETK